MRYVILPQAIKNVLPAMANNFVLLLKDTSLASTVAVSEISYLTRQYRAIASATLKAALPVIHLCEPDDCDVTRRLLPGVALAADRRED